MLTSDNTPMLIHINPYTEQVEIIPFTDSLSELNLLVGGRFIQPVNFCDHVLLVAANNLEEEPYPPAWSYSGHDLLYFGCAILGKLDEDGRFGPPEPDERQVSLHLEWMGFPEPENVLLSQDFDVDEADSE